MALYIAAYHFIYEQTEHTRHLHPVDHVGQETDGNLQSGFVIYLLQRSGLKERKIRDIVDELPSTLKDKIMSTADMFIEKGRKLGIETGKKIGFEQGLEKGIETGIEKGMQKGIERGLESGKMAFVMNLLKNTEFDTAKIAALADVSEEYVEAIREGFRKE